MTTRYSDELMDEIRQKYCAGESIEEIAKECKLGERTVQRWLDGERPSGNRGETRHKQLGIMGRPVTGGITREKIEQTRKHTYVGSGIIIHTCKGTNEDNSSGNHTGVDRMARVVDVSYKYFCLVELSSGIREAVLWTDLVKG